MWLLRSSLAPYVLLFDPKPLIEDSNLQVHMQLCMDEKSLRSLFELATGQSGGDHRNIVATAANVSFPFLDF